MWKMVTENMTLYLVIIILIIALWGQRTDIDGLAMMLRVMQEQTLHAVANTVKNVVYLQ